MLKSLLRVFGVISALMVLSFFTVFWAGMGWAWWCALAAAVVLWYALAAARVGASFWLAHQANVRHGGAHTGAPWPVWWRAFLGEWQASERFMVRWMPRAQPIPGPLAPLSEGAARVPVLLIHGFMCNHALWRDWVAALRAQGHWVHQVDLEPLFGSIDDLVPLVARAVAELQQASGQPKVAIVGHSMGGLVARAWLRVTRAQQASAATDVSAVPLAALITLGSPHVGTQVKGGQWATNVRQMAWQSAWLQALAASETPADRAHFHLALALRDNIVFPAAAQVLPGAAVQTFEGVGHLALIQDPAVQQWAWTILGQLLAHER